MPVPTRRLALLVALSGLALVPTALPQPQGWLVVCAVVVAAAVVDVVAATSPKRIDVRRDLPAVIALDAPATLRWTVHNPARRAARVAIADELAPSLGAARRRVQVRVPARASVVVTTDVRPRRRGEFVIDELAVRVEGPLGLMARQRTRHVADQLRVIPSFRSRDEAELRIDKARILDVGLRSAKGRGGGTEFDQLRDYTVDDEYRRVDWAATARAGRPIVRAYRAERNQTVVNLLDNGRLMAGTVNGVARIEHAMDAVMALTTVATRLGDRCGLLAFDREVRAVVPPSHAAHQLATVVDAMFDLEPVLAESDYRSAFTEALVRFRRRAMVVLYTELAEQAVGESLLPALPLLARNHVLVVAAVSDPQVLAWANARADDETDAYRSAAAVAAIEERRRVVARLRGLGAIVVDAPPGKLAAMLADTYLHVKATSRL